MSGMGWPAALTIMASLCVVLTLGVVGILSYVVVRQNKNKSV